MRFFRENHLVSEAAFGTSSFDTPIGIFGSQHFPEVKLEFGPPKGDPPVGPKVRLEDPRPPLYGTDVVGFMRSEQQEEVKRFFKMIANPSEPSFDEMMAHMDWWWERLELEVLMTYLSSMRGTNDYEVYTQIQPAFEPKTIDGVANRIDTRDGMPQELQKYFERNELVLPHLRRHIASWQSADDMLKHRPVTYGDKEMAGFGDPIAGTSLFERLSEINRYLIHLKRDGFQPADLRAGDRHAGSEAKRKVSEYFIMLVSPEMVHAINCDAACQLREASGKLGLKAVAFEIERLPRLLLMECDDLVRFKVKLPSGEKTFTRSLILGREALAISKLHEPKVEDIKKWQQIRQDYQSASFGAKVLVCDDPNSGKPSGEEPGHAAKVPRTDRGRVIFDALIS